MKTLLLFATVLLIPTGGFAQEAKPGSTRPRVVLPANPRPAQTAQARPAPPRLAPKASTTLSENVVMHWLGSFQGQVELDFHLTGCGPEFQSQFSLPHTAEDGGPASIFTIEATVKRTGERYHVEYSIGARVAVKTQVSSGRNGGPVSTNYEFRERLTSGAIIVTLGEPLILTKVDGKELSFSLSAAK